MFTRAVFMVAEFYMEYQLVYSVPSCDYQLFNLKQKQLHEFICQKSVEKCPFHTTASCHHLTANVHQSHALICATYLSLCLSVYICVTDLLLNKL